VDSSLRSLVDAVLDGALVVGDDGVIVHANAAARRIARRDDLAGRPVGELLIQHEAAEHVGPYELVEGRGASDVQRPDGTRIAVRLAMVRAGACWMVVMHDGTPERLLDIERMAPEQMHQTVFGIAEALDAYLFSGELTPDGYYVGTFTGPGAEKLLGTTETLERPDSEWNGRVHPDDYPTWEAAYLRAAVNPGEPFEVEYRLHGIDGVWRWIRERGVVRRLGDGRVVLDGVALDVTREHAAAEQFRRVFELSNDLIMTYDRNHRIRLINPAVRTLLGYEPEEVVEHGWSLLVHPDDADGDYAQIDVDFERQRATPVTVRCMTKDGQVRWFSWTGAWDPEDDLMLYVGRDVTSDVEHRTEMERQSRTDSLTGLANRRHLVEVLHAELGRAAREGRAPGVVLIDLDRFKIINDTHGHPAGDAVLIEVGRRLRRAIRAYDTVGRWGGEEFCVVLPGLESDEELHRAAEHLRAAITAAPVGAGPELLLQVTSSAGGALAQAGLWSVEALIDAADRALYSAKRRGRDGTRLFGELTVEDLVAEEPEAIRLAQALALSAGAREGIAENHCAQVADLAAAIAGALGLPEVTVMRCRLAGWLHDLGKIGIPDAILTKAGPLDDEEWAVMRTHAEIGESILRRIAGLSDAAAAVRHHHERFDGTGYPDGLAADEIPIEARIVACADTYSAITVDRVYRRARPAHEAVAELRAVAGSQLDPAVMDAAVSVLVAAPERAA
jgi:diguanylate cyclase (GGDEF)-like protein/PAS domain S-box-containing protein